MSSGKKCEKGLTIVELMVVMAVIAIISSIMIVAFADVLDRSKQRATMADMRTISRAIEAYAVDNDGLPDDSNGLTSLAAAMVTFTNKKLPTQDHWGHPYRYVRVGPSHYTLESFGKDGVNSADFDPEHSRDASRDLVMFSGIFVAAPNQ